MADGSTFLELQARVQALVTLGGWSNVLPAPNYPYLVNEGLRIFTRESWCNWETLMLTTVVNQGDYDLIADSPTPGDDREWIYLSDDALWNVLPDGCGNLSASYLPQASRNQLRKSDPTWRSYSPTQPMFWYWSNSQVITLWPPPTTPVLCTWEGVRHVPKLEGDMDSPQINQDYHEAIALFGAWHWGKLYARGEERAVALSYKAEAMELVGKYKLNTTSKQASLMQRRVARPAQEYVDSGFVSIQGTTAVVTR